MCVAAPVRIAPHARNGQEESTRIMSRTLAPVFLALTLLAASPAQPALAKDETPLVRVVGTGIAAARPDLANISIGVVSEGTTAAEALEKNTAAMSRVMVELKSQKIEPKDIQTTNFSVSPKFQYFKDGNPPVITGYKVVNSVRVVVRNLDTLGEVLDQAVSSGSNQINAIQFGIDDDDTLEDKARENAMVDARRKAALYAKASEAKLGKILSISEGAVSGPPQPPMARAALESKSSAVPVAPGEHKVTAQVTVTWELKD